MGYCCDVAGGDEWISRDRLCPVDIYKLDKEGLLEVYSTA